jgi:hypothetical protein
MEMEELVENAIRQCERQATKGEEGMKACLASIYLNAVDSAREPALKGLNDFFHELRTAKIDAPPEFRVKLNELLVETEMIEQLRREVTQGLLMDPLGAESHVKNLLKQLE